MSYIPALTLATTWKPTRYRCAKGHTQDGATIFRGPDGTETAPFCLECVYGEYAARFPTVKVDEENER